MDRPFPSDRSAMYYLFYFFMNGITSQKGIKFLQFHPAGRIFTIFGRDVARHTGYSRLFLLGTFQNYLNSITFLSHCFTSFYE